MKDLLEQIVQHQPFPQEPGDTPVHGGASGSRGLQALHSLMTLLRKDAPVPEDISLSIENALQKAVIPWLDYLALEMISASAPGFRDSAADQLCDGLHGLLYMDPNRTVVASHPKIIELSIRVWLSQKPNTRTPNETAEQDRSESNRGLEITYKVARIMLATSVQSGPNFATKIIAATENSTAQAANVVVSYLCSPMSDKALTNLDIQALFHTIRLISRLVRHKPFQDALLTHNIIHYVTRVLCFMTSWDRVDPDVPRELVIACTKACFDFLRSNIESTGGVTWIAQALEADLVSTIIWCLNLCDYNCEPDEHNIVTTTWVDALFLHFFAVLLPTYLVYRTTLTPALINVISNRRPWEEALRLSRDGVSLFGSWIYFKTLAVERLDLLPKQPVRNCEWEKVRYLLYYFVIIDKCSLVLKSRWHGNVYSLSGLLYA